MRNLKRYHFVFESQARKDSQNACGPVFWNPYKNSVRFAGAVGSVRGFMERSRCRDDTALIGRESNPMICRSIGEECQPRFCGCVEMHTTVIAWNGMTFKPIRHLPNFRPVSCWNSSPWRKAARLPM